MKHSISLVILAGLLAGCGLMRPGEQEPLAPAPQPSTVEIKMTFFGDVFWGRRVQTWSEASELKEAYPFSGLGSFEKSARGNWIANLECPTTTQEVSQSQQENTLRFNCRPTYLSEAAKHFDVFSLANNHTDNVDGQWGLDQSRENLEVHGIQHFGHYDNAVLEDVCEVVSLEATITYDDGSQQPGTYPIALCGHHNLYKLPSEESLAVVGEYAQYFPTFAMPHQGAEYVTKSDSLQQRVYRQLIDLGADAVIGGHTHSVIDTEVYNGKLIAYSIGNFIFDQQGTEMKRTGLPITATVTMPYNESLASLDCAEFQEGCLGDARLLGIKKSELEINYTATPSDNANRLAKKASPEVAARVLQMANWAETLAELEAISSDRIMID